MAIWNILRTIEIFYDHYLHFELIGYILNGFGTMYQGKSGNPGHYVDIQTSSHLAAETLFRQLRDSQAELHQNLAKQLNQSPQSILLHKSVFAIN
jgi:hypothetical protein